jgi:formate dehydrogenase iron-sulfur subunit
MTTVWVPCDAAARAVGADEVAEAFAAAGATVRRNGSRGMLWLEPLVEVETDAGRIGYVVAEVTTSGLRGRGGAGFPTGHQVGDRPHGRE